jgi:hypothetical protein
MGTNVMVYTTVAHWWNIFLQVYFLMFIDAEAREIRLMNKRMLVLSFALSVGLEQCITMHLSRLGRYQLLKMESSEWVQENVAGPGSR